MRRGLGALLLLGGAAVAALGAVWVFLAIVGREWDYCRTGSECIAGELVGGAVVAGGIAVAWIGRMLMRRWMRSI